MVNGWVTKVGNHSGDLGAPFVTAVTAAVAAFATATGLHVTESGEISPISITALTAQHALAVQMQTNLYTVGIANSDAPAEIIVIQIF